MGKGGPLTTSDGLLFVKALETTLMDSSDDEVSDDVLTSDSRTNDRILAAQKAEPGWQSIIAQLQGETAAATPRLQRIAQQYAIRNQILHKIVASESSKRLAVVVPLVMRAALLHRAHDSKEAGHLGVVRT